MENTRILFLFLVVMGLTSSSGRTIVQDEADTLGKMIIEQALQEAEIPDTEVSVGLGRLASATVSASNCESSNVRVRSNSTSLTRLDDTTLELTTFHLAVELNADWSAIIYYFFFSSTDGGIVSYELFPVTMSVVYSIESPGDFSQVSCNIDFEISPPTMTSERGYGDYYSSFAKGIEDSLDREPLIAEICKQLSPDNDFIQEKLELYRTTIV